MKNDAKRTVDISQFSAIVLAPFGAVGLTTHDEKVSSLTFLPDCHIEKKASDAFSMEVSRQLSVYLKRPDFNLDFPVVERGTDFQKKVWQEMKKIPVGQTLTYGEVARRIQSGPRAVGGACAINPLVLFYPCHRIVAASGIGGFSGETDTDSVFLNIKRWLLRHEGVLKN